MSRHEIGCPFCALIDSNGTGAIDWRDLHPFAAVSFEPLHPVTPGHRLVVSKEHVRDASESPLITADVFRAAAHLAREPYNLITSAGTEATQTVFHLHVHIVPRHEDDGLKLPWTGQH